MARRMFVAIELPERITRDLAGLDPHLPGLRWLPARPLHLTLEFLAAVPEENEARWIRELAGIEGPSFPLELRGLGSFGRRGHPLVVWAGLADPPELLFAMQAMVRDAAKAAGLEVDTKGFHPHVTVGRCRQVSAVRLQAFLDKHRDDRFGCFEVAGFTLIASELRAEGPQHQVVFRRVFGTA